MKDVLLTRLILSSDTRMARLIHGMEIPDSGLGGYGVQGCGAGYDGIWRHGESSCSRAWRTYLGLTFVRCSILRLRNQVEVSDESPGAMLLLSDVSLPQRLESERHSL
jgi:hypothetical protein